MPDADQLAVGAHVDPLADPKAAGTTAYSRIEARLAEMLDEAGLPSYTAVGGPALALLAR